MQIETYIRAAGTNGMLVDAANMPAAVTPPTTCLGMSADIRIHFFNGDVAAQMTAEDFDAITTWRLSVDSDYNQSTEPLLRYTNGIDVDDDGTVCVLIPNVSSQKLIEALRTQSSGEYIAELVGYAAGETVPVFVVQFPFVVSNRIDLEGGDETEPVEGNYYTNAQINALLSAPYDVQFSVDCVSWHSEQTYLDEYFRIRNSAVQGAEWSEPMRLLAGVIAQEQADWDETDTTSKAYINNKPVVAGAATNAQIDSRSASQDIRPSNVDYAVRSVLPNVTTIPAATTSYSLVDASATTNNHSWQYAHTPASASTYVFPTVTNTAVAHRIKLTLDFTAVQTYSFEDASGNALTPLFTPTISTGDVYEFDCEYSAVKSQWLIWPHKQGAVSDDYVMRGEVGAANGVAGLDSSGKVPESELNMATDGTNGRLGAVYTNANKYGIYVHPTYGRLQIQHATDAEIDAKDSNYKPIVPSNLEYAVRSVLPNVTAIPAATTAYTLLDASATTNSHSACYTHAPTGIPTYTLPAVTDATTAHEILLDVDFTTVQACGFLDSQGAEIPLQRDISIAAGDKWRFICVYSLDGWRVYPLPIGVAGGGGGGIPETLVISGTTATSAGLAGYYAKQSDTMNGHAIWKNATNSKYIWLCENGMDAGWFAWVIGSTVAQQSAGDIPMFYDYFVSDVTSPADTPVGLTWRTQMDVLTEAQFACAEG